MLKLGKDDLGRELEDEIPLCIFDVSLTERKSRYAIKFSTNDDKILTQSFMPETDFEHMKEVAATVIQVKPIRIIPYVTKIELMEQEELVEFKNDTHKALICMFDSETLMERLRTIVEYEDLVIPDYLCVTVKLSTIETTKCVPVKIYNRAIPKPWDGGYRDIRKGIEFHNGFSQTGPRPQVRGPDLMNNRDTQTSYCRNRKLDMPYSRATQMYNDSLFISCITDTILTPRPYETADEREKRLDKETKVRTIQRYFRAWKMRKCLAALSEEYHLRMRRQREREEAENLRDWRRRRRDLICQIFPRSRVDFGMLYSLAEKWKRGEIDRISAMYCGPAKVAELAILSDKEVEIFRVIDKLKKEVHRDTREQTNANYLKKLGKPTKWYCSYKYIPVEMDSLENQRARKLDELYQKVIDRCTSEPKRIDALYELKLSLKNDDCEISIQLNVLIDRAIGLLSRGFSTKDIESLQKRIDATCLYHFKQKECFEELNTLPEKKKEEFMRSNIFVCQRCQNMKTIDSFRLNARTEKINICNSCRYLDKTLEPWADLSPYRFILHHIRRTERLNNSPSSVAYILQDRDIHHLITQIWHSHSAVSECNDIYNLRLMRWQRDIDWSPWNCILLTVEEGKAHVKIDDLEKVYEKEFMDHIYNKHALARRHFEDLMNVENRFKKMFKVSSVDNLDPNGYNDFRKIFRVDRTKRLYF